jgi:hypothetical protein
MRNIAMRNRRACKLVCLQTRASELGDIFTPLRRNTAKTAWFIDEFGAVLPSRWSSRSYFWRKLDQLEPTPSSPKEDRHLGSLGRALTRLSPLRVV